jgi:hypothetical protein
MNWFQFDLFVKSLLHFNLRNLAILAGLITLGNLISQLTLVAGIITNIWLLLGIGKFVSKNKVGIAIKEAVIFQIFLSQFRNRK